MFKKALILVVVLSFSLGFLLADEQWAGDESLEHEIFRIGYVGIGFLEELPLAPLHIQRDEDILMRLQRPKKTLNNLFIQSYNEDAKPKWGINFLDKEDNFFIKYFEHDFPAIRINKDGFVGIGLGIEDPIESKLMVKGNGIFTDDLSIGENLTVSGTGTFHQGISTTTIFPRNQTGVQFSNGSSIAMEYDYTNINFWQRSFFHDYARFLDAVYIWDSPENPPTGYKLAVDGDGLFENLTVDGILDLSGVMNVVGELNFNPSPPPPFPANPFSTNINNQTIELRRDDGLKNVISQAAISFKNTSSVTEYEMRANYYDDQLEFTGNIKIFDDLAVDNNLTVNETVNAKHIRFDGGYSSINFNYNQRAFGIEPDYQGNQLNINGYTKITTALSIGTTFRTTEYYADEAHGGYKLAVEGKILANEVQVKSFDNWPDYVFEDSYELPKLNELESFIASNKHLPNIPTKDEVAEEGFGLGEMQAKLLQKVEELTLYIIDLQKQNNVLNEKVNELSKQSE
jgi:hypothetical protein